MGKFSESLTEAHQQFIREQKMFFVATAPAGEGRINLSPKGYDTLCIVSDSRIMYADYAGSGNETANHLAERNQITFMWNSFDEDPLILRVYGTGKVVGKSDAAFERQERLTSRRSTDIACAKFSTLTSSWCRPAAVTAFRSWHTKATVRG